MDERIKFFVGLMYMVTALRCPFARPGGSPAGLSARLRNVLAWLKTLCEYGAARRVSVFDEAGPTGYGLYRALIDRDYHCEVISPSLTPRRPGECIKTGRRDRLRLAELSRAGELKAIWVRDQAHEALRNHWRDREDAVNQRLQARHQLKAFWLRQGRRCTGKTPWNEGGTNVGSRSSILTIWPIRSRWPSINWPCRRLKTACSD